MGTPAATGPAFRINSVGSFSEGRSVATLKDGTFVVVWLAEVIENLGNDPETGDPVLVRHSTVQGQTFYANGDKLGAEFLVSSRTGDYAAHNNLSVAALKDGGFAVSYSYSPDGAPVNEDVFLRVYETDRTAGAEFLALENNESWQGVPTLTALDNGGFALSYMHSDTVAPQSGQPEELETRFQAYDANGNRTGTNILVSSTSNMNQMTTLKNGNIVVAYEDFETGDVLGHIYRPDGSEVTSADGIVLPTTLDGYQIQPSITALADGRFVAVWTQQNPTSEDPSSLSVRGRIFNADGTPVGGDFQINAKTEGLQRTPSVAALPNGGFAVAYIDLVDKPVPGDRTVSLRLASFGADGTRDGDEIMVATGGSFDVENPALSALADGRLLLTWSEFNGNRDPYSAAQVFDPRVESLDWAGSDEEDNYVGTVFNDTLKGLAGQDRLYGNAGSDTLDGGTGADSLDGGAGVDVASYAKAASRVSVDLAKKTGSAGEAAGDVLKSIEGVTGSDFDDALVGDTLANLLKGGRGKDNLQGGAGDDKLWGGLGHDQLKGGTGKDAFVFDAKAGAKTNRDKIVDFSVKDDSIWLDNAVFAKLGAKGSADAPAQLKKGFFTIGEKAKDKNDYIIYDDKKGVLYYDADGSGTKSKAVEIATLSKNLKITYKDFFVI
ncbi:calcium-binding protein [Microvirga flavescens]|uniref:calcium-binding protein n=1 Tax=Microvirga flavescens TaxID=2249811 RepID=UPI002478F2F8|nr:calcium-binding protein [Microvirga flavescens]